MHCSHFADGGGVQYHLDLCVNGKKPLLWMEVIMSGNAIIASNGQTKPDKVTDISTIRERRFVNCCPFL